jgi:hypothetical protein
MAQIEVTATGPIADGSAPQLVDEGLRAAERATAFKAQSLLRQHFHAHFRDPTGYYESNVTISEFPNGTKISDNGVIYGPWLEGVGSRNATTRFKGYHAFREVTQMVEGAVGEITEHELAIRLERA